jgi:hypothetical protein
MRCTLLLVPVFIAGAVSAAEPSKKPALIARPDAFETLVHPDCSHCRIEANRRKQELRADDRVLCWIQIQTDGYINDGAIPIRFFLNAYRVLSDSWGVFVHDPDAGFARGFDPAAGPFAFHGWRNGVMVFKSKDGSLYSSLTGIAFEGPKKGSRLEPRPTVVTDWGFWHERYPQAVAFAMYDKFKPAELPAVVNEDSRQSRVAADGRLPADTPVLGVWDGKRARAYPIDTLEKAGVIHETTNGHPRLVLWYAPTKTAAAFHQPFGTSGLAGDAGWIFSVDPEQEAAAFIDKRTGLHWDITGRPAERGPRLAWLDSVQVKWFAWAAEYPDTSIYGHESAKVDFKPLTGKSEEIAGPLGNLDVTVRHFGILKAVDAEQRRITLLVDGESEPKEWSLSPGAELRCAGCWSRLDQFQIGDRVWAWFEIDREKHPVAVTLLADEISEQDLYAPVRVTSINIPATGQGTVTLESSRAGKQTTRTVNLAKAEFYRGNTQAPLGGLQVGEQVNVQTTGEDARLILDPATFESRRAAQKAALRQRWADEGLPGTVAFAHSDRREVEVMLDHEAMRWGRSLQPGENVVLRAAKPIHATVRQIRPWRERTQILLGVDSDDASPLSASQRVFLRLDVPPRAADDDQAPTGLGKSQTTPERVAWIMSGTYCTCGMHDACAGHLYTLGACISDGPDPCGLAKRTRKELAEKIDAGFSDRQIFDDLLKERGPKLLRPHMSP